jgi:uncharacterized protein (TIGR02145 family)
MKPSHRILGFIFIGILLLACENEQQAWLSEMEGAPMLTIPAIVGKGLPVTIATGGITTPGNVAYTWNAPGFSPSTFTGAIFETTAPTVAGEHEVLITAHAAGYRDVTKKGKIMVVECTPMQGRLNIEVPEDVIKEETVQFTARGITLPVKENITYEWSIPGFPADSYTGDAVFETAAPTNPGTYTIFITAKAENYCNVDTSKMILVKPGRKIQGIFDFDYSPQPAIKGQKITFAAKGITAPSAEKIRYEWFAPAFTAGTPSGNSYTATCPSHAGTYAVTVTAKAEGYSDSTVRRAIYVGDELPMEGHISISVLSSEVVVSKPITFRVTNNITIPSEGITYIWDAPSFTPDTYQSSGNTFTATAPATEGSRVIMVTASAAKYRGTSATVTVDVKGGFSMTGELDFNVPSQIVKDLEAPFSINSTLSTPDGSPITYEWDAPGFDAATYAGPTFTGIPRTAGSHTITLHAKANGYITRSTPKTVNVIDGLDMGDLTIVANGYNPPCDAGINTVTFTPELTPPIPGVTYTWEASGCTPDVFTEKQYRPFLPPTAGTHTITLTAQATGYHPKQVSFSYTIACNQLPISVNLTRSELLTNDKTTLTANLSAPIEASYTWTIPTGFAVTGSLTAASVTITAPPTGLVNPAIITLSAKAVNYCDASDAATITVKECYPSTYTPVINSSATFTNGIFHASNLQEVEFYTLPITPLRSGGTATYAWSINAPSSSRSFTPSNSPAAMGNTTFKTKAPGHSADTYNLTLQVAADGFCPFAPVPQVVKVDSSKGKLTGTIEISEVVAPFSEPNKPVLWIAKDRPITLQAHYSAGDGETIEELELRFKWYWVNGASYILLGENNGTLKDYAPPTEVTNQRIRVEVHDLNGKASIAKEYPYYVQNCSDNNLPGLHINVNYQCRIEGVRVSAYVMDSLDNNYIYQVKKIGTKWWLTQNLRANKQGNAYTGYINTYGAYYHAGLVNELGQTDGRYCPKGWRIPTSSEWSNLNNAVNSSNNTLVFQGLATAAEASNPAVGDVAWNKTLIENLPGSNSVGFNLTPAGAYYSNNIIWSGTRAVFFTHGGSIVQAYGIQNIGPEEGSAYTLALNPSYSYTARCVND